MEKHLYFLLLIFFPTVITAQEEEGFEKNQFITKQDTLNYRILYPEGFSEEKEYPLVLFLHGAGERGSDNDAQLLHGGKLFLENKISNKYPAIVIFPQCPKDDYWANVAVVPGEKGTRFNFKKEGEPTLALSLVMKLTEEMLTKPFVKKSQVYIGGLSMGAMGTFEMLYRKPNDFAAAIAICGGAHPDTAKEYARNTELWIFHGAKDTVVTPEHSMRMAQAIHEAGGKANLTIYENATHNSWDPAFAEPGLLEWLFSKKNKE